VCKRLIGTLGSPALYSTNTIDPPGLTDSAKASRN
jgi:hypothetical protein